MNTRLPQILLVFALSCHFTPIHAADVVLEKVVRAIDLNADGTFVQSNEMLMRLESEQGAKGASQMPIPYSESLQSLEIAEAYTLKADGTRIDVAKDKIFTQAAPIAISAPTFNDIKYKIIVFPEPERGGKLYFRAVVKQIKPFFPNHFSAMEVLPTMIALESFTIRLTAPNGYALKTDSRDVEGGKLEDKDGRARWEWKYASKTARKIEPFEVVMSDFGPFVAVSSFADWADLAKAYRARAASKVAVTPQIQALADDITKGITEPRLQVEAIHHWAARNVRYVAVFLGLGGFVPREASEILATKYGDCKDHTVILEALLKAKGIDSSPVLIHSEASFVLPKVAAVGAFNHAITYVPSLDLYLDGTASFNRFPTLPNTGAGKPVLIVNTGKLSTTPRAGPKVDKLHTYQKLNVKMDGSLSGKAFVTATGLWESRLRQQIAAVPAGESEKFVASMLGAEQKGGGVSMNSDANDLGRPLTFSANFQIKDAVTLDSPGAFRIPRGFQYASIQSAMATTDIDTAARKTPFKCVSDTRIEELEIQLPDSVKVAALPKNVSHKTTTISFEATYKQEGQKIFVNRTLVRERDAEFCAPSMWNEGVQAQAVVARDARAQVLLQ